MSERAVLRLAAGSAVAGAVLALVGNLLHPRISEFDDPAQELLGKIGAAWIPIHLVILLATLLILFGLYGVVRSLKAGRAQPLARVALGTLLVAAPVAVVSLAVDGYATGAAAEAATAAATEDRAVAQVAFEAVEQVSWALFMALVLMVLGVAPVALGLAIAAGDEYPTVFGWPAVAVGGGSIVAGAIGYLGGPSAAFFILFTVTSGLLTLWVLALGVTLWRRVAAGAVGHAARPELAQT